MLAPVCEVSRRHIPDDCYHDTALRYLSFTQSLGIWYFTQTLQIGILFLYHEGVGGGQPVPPNVPIYRTVLYL